MFVLLFLHIGLMFTAVAVAMGAGILVLIGARRGDRSVVAALTSLPIPRVAPPLYISGGIFGLLTGIAFGYNLLAPWLIIAYVLFALLTALGILYSGPVFERTHAVAIDPQVSVEAFGEAMGRYRADVALTALGVALIIADMVFKPFS
jgi:hypothetical protein